MKFVFGGEKKRFIVIYLSNLSIANVENCGRFKSLGYIYILALCPCDAQLNQNSCPCDARLNQNSYVNSFFFINLLKI